MVLQCLLPMVLGDLGSSFPKFRVTRPRPFIKCFCEMFLLDRTCAGEMAQRESFACGSPGFYPQDYIFTEVNPSTALDTSSEYSQVWSKPLPPQKNYREYKKENWFHLEMQFKWEHACQPCMSS